MNNFFSLQICILLACIIIVINSSCKDDTDTIPSHEIDVSDTLRYSVVNPIDSWELASTPNTGAFDKSDVVNDLAYNDDRASTALYLAPQLDTEAYDSISHYNRKIPYDELNIDLIINELQENSYYSTFDLAYFPNERGPYNFNYLDLDLEGKLTNPETRWGGFQRPLYLEEFDIDEFDFIEFWLLDPFLENSNNQGNLYLNLGKVSEDILKDGRHSFENGLPVPGEQENTDTTKWARVPNYDIDSYTFNEISNNENLLAQDVGLDGLDNEGERIVYEEYLSNIQSSHPNIFQTIFEDPANDDFKVDFENETRFSNIYRYKNNPQGNSMYSNIPVPNALTLLPNHEDLNKDNFLEQEESFFEYKVTLKPNMQIGENFIIDLRTISNVTIPHPDTGIPIPAKWYNFRIPISDYSEAFGGINNFSSLENESIRIYLSGFTEPVVLRFIRFYLTEVN